MAQGSDDRRGSDLPRGDFKGGGLRLSSLKHWRERRGLSQGQLAKLVGVPRHYVQRVEQGRRGCNPWVAQKMAEESEVDLEELRAGSALEKGEKGTEGDVRTRRGGPPVAKPRRSSLHRAYLEALLEREVGSAYSALEEGEFEDRCMGLPVEELLEIVSSRERERKLLKEVLADTTPLHPDVRAFLEELLREQPGEDLRILAARIAQEHSQEAHERLSRAMRGLFP